MSNSCLKHAEHDHFNRMMMMNNSGMFSAAFDRDSERPPEVTSDSYLPIQTDNLSLLTIHYEKHYNTNKLLLYIHVFHRASLGSRRSRRRTHQCPKHR